MRNPEYVVTGAAGFIGSQVVWNLLEQGRSVRASDVRSPSWLACNRHFNSGQLEFMMADLTDVCSLYAVVRGARYAVHSGALFDHSASYDGLMRVNVNGTENFLRAAVAYGLERVVHIGSMSVYGHDQKAVGGSEFAIDETKTPDPADPYAESKQLSRLAAAKYNGDLGFQVRIVDPAGIFGPRSIYGNVGIIKALVNGMMLLPDGGIHRASMVHSEDVSGLCCHLLGLKDTIKSGDAQEISYLSADTTPISAIDMMEMIWDEIPSKAQKHLMRRITSRMPIRKGFVMPLAHIVDLIAKAYNSTVFPVLRECFGVKNKMRPDLDSRAIAYGFGDHTSDPAKGLDTGFVLKYPRTEQTIKSVMDWHKRYGLLEGKL